MARRSKSKNPSGGCRQPGSPHEDPAGGGSDSSIFATDDLAPLGLVPEPRDRLRRIVGVGGREYVLTKRIEKLSFGPIQMSEFLIQIGAMEYGFPIQGVLGMDFLLKTAPVIDLGELEISWKEQEPSPPS
ncbi:MAG TPA: retropepsin-like aspartic protease [Thermoanaerobaculia bacterium]|nr:retropepsin-like aspartic protease [Thermoanaerobaculia bacterium]